jgi:hypothetical protein
MRNRYLLGPVLLLEYSEMTSSVTSPVVCDDYFESAIKRTLVATGWRSVTTLYQTLTRTPGLMARGSPSYAVSRKAMRSPPRSVCSLATEMNPPARHSVTAPVMTRGLVRPPFSKNDNNPNATSNAMDIRDIRVTFTV